MSTPADNKKDNKFVCYNCFKLKRCKDPTISWILFFIAITATISIRAVNLVLDTNPLLAKTFWYIGILGFTIFFIYKYRYNNMLQRELKKADLIDKLLRRESLLEQDYDILGTILCKLSSNKDKLNYFFIFLFSALALALAVYVDFFKG